MTETTPKQTLRRRLRSARRRLTADEQREHSLAVCRHLQTSALGLRRMTIAAYSSADGEVDVTPFLQTCWQRRITTALPVIDRGVRGARAMRFRVTEPTSRVQQNRYGILEPVAGQDIPALALGAVLTPVVGFDATGHRLGMGGGYYDRFFHGPVRPLLIGVAHALQQVAHIDADAWDIDLDAIVTERGVVPFTKRAMVLRLY